MSTSLVDYRTEAGVAVITLTDPPMNAFTHDMMKELDECLLDARFDNDVQVIVITGHGERFFCTGPNFKMLSEVDDAFRHYFYLHADETIERLERTPKVTVAALAGHAIGGGLEIALACDLRIARLGSSRFGFPEVPLGLAPGLGAAKRLARAVGGARATRWLLEGAALGAADAVAAGIVHEIWEAPSREAFEQRVVSYVRRFVSKQGPLSAFGSAKQDLAAALSGTSGRTREPDARAAAPGDRNFEQEILTYLGEHATSSGSSSPSPK